MSRRCRVIAACAVLLSGCLPLALSKSVDVTSGDKSTFLYVDVPTKKIEFNRHGGGWSNGMDRYKLSIPRGEDDVAGKDIRLELLSAEAPLPVHASSKLRLTGKGKCNVTLQVLNEAGAPYEFNGTYTTNFQCDR